MPGSKGQGNGVGIEVILKANTWFAKHKDELHGLSIPEIMKRVQADLGLKIGHRTIKAMRTEYGIRGAFVRSPEKVTAVKRLDITERNVQKLIEIAGLVAETLEALGEGSVARQIRHLFPSE